MAKVDVYDVLMDVAKDINKQFKLEVAIPGKEESHSDVRNWVPSNSTMLNLLFGDEDFGIPEGRIIEIFGDFSEGKSTVAQHIMHAFQAAGGLSNLIDSESGWDRDRAVRIGHNPNRHLHIEVDTCESGFDVLYQLNEKYLDKFGGSIPIVYVWDTLAAAPTQGEKEGEEFSSGMMFKARKIRQELRRLCGELPKCRATLIIVNQTIEGPKPNRTGVKTTPGGGGVKFWSSQRLQVEKVARFHEYENKSKLAGIISKGKMVKNKLHPPFREVDLPITFHHGIDPIREVMNYHLDNTDVVNVSGAYKKILGFTEKDISFYERDTMKIFSEHDGLLDYLVEEAKVHWVGAS